MRSFLPAALVVSIVSVSVACGLASGQDSKVTPTIEITYTILKPGVDASFTDQYRSRTVGDQSKNWICDSRFMPADAAGKKLKELNAKNVVEYTRTLQTTNGSEAVEATSGPSIHDRLTLKPYAKGKNIQCLEFHYERVLGKAKMGLACTFDSSDSPVIAIVTQSKSGKPELLSLISVKPIPSVPEH